MSIAKRIAGTMSSASGMSGEEQQGVGEPNEDRDISPPILNLPDEILLEIFLHLDHASIARCAKVCKKLNRLSKDTALFRVVTIEEGEVSLSCAEWLLRRTTNPKDILVEGKLMNISHLIEAKLGTWHNLQELYLWKLDLRKVDEGSLGKLKSLKVYFCSFSCDTLEPLLRHSTALCKVIFWLNKCFNCVGRCRTGILSFVDSAAFRNNVEKVILCSTTNNVAQQDLNRLSVCTNLKTLTVDVHCTAPSALAITEAKTAMEMVASRCTKLESVTFSSLDYITDNVLTALIANCPMLEELRLQGIPAITEDVCVMAIDVLTRLRTMSIYNCHLLSKESGVKLRKAVRMARLRSNAGSSPMLFFTGHNDPTVLNLM